jgi:peroxiredoxin Q/BCP
LPSILPLPPFNALLKPGEAAPDFHLLDQDGRSVGLSDALQGKQGAVILFFASDFLAGDQRLLHAYGAAFPQFRERGLAVLALSGINWERIHHLARRLETPFPMLFDSCCRIATRYRAMWIPKFVSGRAVFVVSPTEEIRFSAHQASPETILRHDDP